MVKLKVLTALDTAKTQYYHFKAIIIAGMGLFTDSYDLFCITPVTILLAHLYYNGHPDIPPVIMSALVGVALLGTAIGQLVFGYLGDMVGRRRVYGLALGLMIVSSLGSGFSICTTSRRCVMGSLGMFRFLLGLGIGGDYPLSATIMSEFANKQTRGAFIAAVFSMQGLGILFSTVVSMTVCQIFDRVTHDMNVTSGDKSHKGSDLAWRIILMFGAVPAGITFYWRMKMPETARYTALVQNNVVQAVKDMEKVLDVSMDQITENSSRSSTPSSTSHLLASSSNTYPLMSRRFLSRHGRDLFSCAVTWFLVDIIFYSNNLFQSKIYKFCISKKDEDKDKDNPYRDAYDKVRLQAIIAICSLIPGYWTAVYFIDQIGRRKIQIMGFLVMALGQFAIGGPYSYWSSNQGTNIGFMVLYGLTFFFSNFGPNTTTFIVPAELFPARLRATCHGISGATGKVGAIIGSIGFLWASGINKHSDQGNRMRASLIILGVISLLGALVTYLTTPETMGRSLEENEKDESEMHGNQTATTQIHFQNPDIQLPA